MAARRPGQRADGNHNWRGGRTVTEHGYVLVKAPWHPKADSRGYVYEHRLVAEWKLGRQLTDGEQVHHLDGNRRNNDPGNLEVLTAAEHRAQHRHAGHDLREPGESNPTVTCACGCGATFPRYDDSNRPQRFVSGHNIQRKA